MKKRLIKYALCAVALGAVLTMSGCTNGIGDTARLVKNAEYAKQAAEQLINGNGEKIVVGTVADPNYKAKKETQIIDFKITCDGTNFHAEWAVETESENVKVQIFADTDTENMDGAKIASYDSTEPYGSSDFKYQLLEDGSYYCYIKVTGADGIPVFAYYADPVSTVLESPEGSLADIEIVLENNSIVFTWIDDSKANQMYHAMIFDPNDTSVVLQETTVADTIARIDAPEDYDFIYAAVASYNDGKIGPYRLYRIDLTVAPTVADSNQSNTEVDE